MCNQQKRRDIELILSKAIAMERNKTETKNFCFGCGKPDPAYHKGSTACCQTDTGSKVEVLQNFLETMEYLETTLDKSPSRVV